jgi:competence protein ComEC
MKGWVFYNSASSSKTLTFVLVFFCLGILVGPLFISVPSLPFLFVTIVLFIFVQLMKNHQRFVLVLLACFLLGIFRYQQSIPPELLTKVRDRELLSTRIEGEIVSDVQRRIGTQQTILSNVRVADESVYGKLLVRFPLYPKLFYGDTITFTCTIERPEPFYGFAYDRQLQAHGVLGVCQFPQFVFVSKPASPTLVSRVLTFRDGLIDRLRLLLPEPHTSFVAGLLFGGSSSISSDLKEDFSRTGTSHILAASGFNVSIFSVLLLRSLLQSPLGRRRGLIVTSILLFLYVIAAGATASVVRAGVMAGLLIVQSAVRRRALMINVVLLALAGMLLINPRLLLDDVGFQLSFAAAASLLFILPALEHRFAFFPNTFGLRTSIAASCTAILFTLPILLWHFGEVSLISPFVNALILPFIPFLMALAAIALASSVLWIPLGQIAAIPVFGLSYLLLRLITLFGSFSFASLPIAFSKTFAVGLTTLLIAWIVYSHHTVKQDSRNG